MRLSLADVLAFPIFETATIVSGENVIKERRVEWVTVIESPVENFVRENELVLSTGIGCYSDPHLLFEFVKDVYESGASALAIATGHYIYSIPADIREFAEKHRFVILDLPWEIRFADIIHEITSALNRLQQKELLHLKEFQQELLELFLTKESLSTIMKVVEEELGMPVLVMDTRGYVAGGSARLSDVRRMWRNMKKNDGVEESHHPIYSRMTKAKNSDSQLFHINIQSNELSQGDFFILSPPTYNMKLKDAHIIEQAVMVAALWLTNENVAAENKGILQKKFVLGLTEEDVSSFTDLRSEAERLGFDIDLPYECMIGLPENLETLYYEEENNQQTKNAWLDNMMAYIEIELADAAQSLHRQIMYTRKNGQLIIYLQTIDPKLRSSGSSETIHQFLDLVDRRLNKLLPGVVVSWGIGKHIEGVHEFHQSCQQALSALEIGRKQKGIGRRYHFDNTKISRLILHLTKDAEVQKITKTAIDPLIQYDLKREMDLIHTFTVYNENAGNVSQAARVLNLHRQSLLYRLRKIESLTALSLANPDDVFLLELSIKIWMASSHEKEMG